MKKGIRKERQKLVMALAINGSDELKTWGNSCVRTFRRLVRESAPQEEIVGVCLRSGEFYVTGRRPDGALLYDGKNGVRDYRKCIREGWAGALSACMCLSDGEVYIYPTGVFYLHGEGASGNAVKEVCLIEKRWRVMGVGVGPYGSGYLVHPVGQKGVENMREALHDTVCELPFEGISEKASQNLAKYGLQAHEIAYMSVALRKVP